MIRMEVCEFVVASTGCLPHVLTPGELHTQSFRLMDWYVVKCTVFHGFVALGMVGMIKGAKLRPSLQNAMMSSRERTSAKAEGCRISKGH